MKIAIFGIGAMGCLFGAKLSKHADVTLIGRWPEQLLELKQARLRLKYPNGTEELYDLTATSDSESVGAVDVALILTKSVKTERAAREAAHILKPDGVAVTLQNGLGNLDMLARHVGHDRAALGVTAQGAAVVAPGVLRYGGMGSTHLAIRSPYENQIQELAELFTQAGLPADVTQDVRSLVWGKLAVNCAINPLTALLRVPNGVLLETEHSRALMRLAALEVAEVAAAQDIDLPFDDAPARAEEVASLTAHNISSMLQDTLRLVPTEIDAICGAVAEIGASMGVSTPTNTMLYHMVKANEAVYSSRMA